MGKAGIIAGKMLSGAAQVLVPAALADQAAKIQAKRDERLQQYAQQNQATDRQFRSEERQKDRDAQLSSTNAQIEAANTRASNKLEFERESFNASKPEQQARMDLLRKQIDNADIDNKIKGLSLDDAELNADMLKTLNDPNIDPDVRDATMELYLLKNPGARREVTVVKTQNDDGEWSFTVFDKYTGERITPGGGSTGAQADLSTLDGIAAAYKAGKITRDQAGDAYDALAASASDEEAPKTAEAPAAVQAAAPEPVGASVPAAAPRTAAPVEESSGIIDRASRGQGGGADERVKPREIDVETSSVGDVEDQVRLGNLDIEQAAQLLVEITNRMAGNAKGRNRGSVAMTLEEARAHLERQTRKIGRGGGR